jgi:hypothetical protein
MLFKSKKPPDRLISRTKKMKITEAFYGSLLLVSQKSSQMSTLRRGFTRNFSTNQLGRDI